MAVRFSVWSDGCRYPRKLPSTISLRGWVDPGAKVRLEELGQLKNLMIASEIEPATLRLVAQCLDQLRYRVPHNNNNNNIDKSVEPNPIWQANSRLAVLVILRLLCNPKFITVSAWTRHWSLASDMNPISAADIRGWKIKIFSIFFRLRKFPRSAAQYMNSFVYVTWNECFIRVISFWVTEQMLTIWYVLYISTSK
jgi:hypothetical protein